jgi:hypothetical protein
MALRGRVFWVAAAAFLIAAAASVGRYRLLAMTTALVTFGAIALVYYENHQRVPTNTATDAAVAQKNTQKGPVTWSRLYINGTAVSQARTPSNISTLSIAGTNGSAEDIKLEDAYFLSGVDGTKLSPRIDRGGGRYEIQNASPLPPGAFFFIVSDSIGPADRGVSPDNFLKTWSTIYFVVKYNGTTQKIEFDRETVESLLAKMKP